MASLSVPRAGSAGRGAAGAAGRTVSTARAGSGAREPLAGADTLCAGGVGVDARWGGGTISTGWGFAGAGAGSGLGVGRTSGAGAGFAAALGAGRGAGAGATATGAGAPRTRREAARRPSVPSRGPRQEPARGRGAPRCRGGRCGAGGAATGARWSQPPRARGALVGRSAGACASAGPLPCGVLRARPAGALVDQQLDASREASPVIELVGHLDLAAGSDVLEPAILGADRDPRGLGHHQRHHAAPERAGVDVDGVGFDLRYPAHGLAVGPVPRRRERVVARIGRPEHQHHRGQEREAPGRSADREKAVAAGYHASSRQAVP